MFKSNWEKVAFTYSLPEGIIEKMLELAHPGQTLVSHDLLVGGCGNLNVKIQFAGVDHPYLLRICLRDKACSYREFKLAHLLKPRIPLPQIHYIGEVDDYCFAISEFMQGMPLCNLLLGDLKHELNDLMYDVGRVLSEISSYSFLATGFFDHNLDVIPGSADCDLLILVKQYVQNDVVNSILTPKIIDNMVVVFNRYNDLLPDDRERHLVHGDFDPANILVERIAGRWQVSAVLDWEFSFSGSLLWDVANMLRYAHKMPAIYTDAFLNGLSSQGNFLPLHWQSSAALLNLVSLLEMLSRSDPILHPRRCIDIAELIEHFLLQLT